MRRQTSLQTGTGCGLRRSGAVRRGSGDKQQDQRAEAMASVRPSYRHLLATRAPWQYPAIHLQHLREEEPPSNWVGEKQARAAALGAAFFKAVTKVCANSRSPRRHR
jgi:hypothetical protein